MEMHGFMAATQGGTLEDMEEKLSVERQRSSCRGHDPIMNNPISDLHKASPPSSLSVRRRIDAIHFEITSEISELQRGRSSERLLLEAQLRHVEASSAEATEERGALRQQVSHAVRCGLSEVLDIHYSR